MPVELWTDRELRQAFNLITQRDSKINFAIAKLQARDSRTVKGIAVLTLFFLPATLVSVRIAQSSPALFADKADLLLQTLWTTNLWTIGGDTNWQVFIAIVVVLTGLVFAMWWAFGRAARRRDERRWPVGSGGEVGELPPLF
jgi:hypothetical protein